MALWNQLTSHLQLAFDPRLFGSTYCLIFVAELPDKTAFATLMLATRKNPHAVFLGVAAAFLIQSVVAVGFGSFLSLLPDFWVKLGSALLFLFFAWRMWHQPVEDSEAVNTAPDSHESPDSVGTAGQNGQPGLRSGFFRSMLASFVVIFIAEWGDLTQLATATLSAHSASPVTIFTAATLALWSVTVLAVVIGTHAKKRINAALIQKIAALAFAGVGLVFLIRLALAR
ncbi:MAG: TMEM165/GDT1 family protein [Methylotenera sp.]|nr:TMEM165/GDT1 family protein [Oligoflexia bacterium]